MNARLSDLKFGSDVATAASLPLKGSTTDSERFSLSPHDLVDF